MKRILVPTDFSDIAGYAMDFAYQLALKFSSEIALFHVMDIPESMGYNDLNITGDRQKISDIDDVYVVKLLQVTRQKMARIINNPKYKDVKITQKIMAGSPYKRIYEEISGKKIDMIVMGTSGVNGWEQSIIGTNAERVVRHATCPVVTLRKPARLDKIRNIAYASDFLEIHGGLINIVKNISKMLSAKIHLVKINTPSRFSNDGENYAMLKSFAADQKLENTELHVFNHENEEKGIIEFSEMFKIDMLIMATKGNTGFLRLLEDSIAEDVVNSAKIPVLTCKTGKA